LPSYGTITTAQFNPALKAGELITAYNPDGWFSDRTLFFETILTIPPKQFSLVAYDYANTYGRNLITDGDYLFNAIPRIGDTWRDYKKQAQ
jgi:hypothetical protein